MLGHKRLVDLHCLAWSTNLCIVLRLNDGAHLTQIAIVVNHRLRRSISFSFSFIITIQIN